MGRRHSADVEPHLQRKHLIERERAELAGVVIIDAQAVVLREVYVQEAPKGIDRLTRLLFRFLGHGGLVSGALPLLALPSAILMRLGYVLLRLITLEGYEEQRSLELARSLSLLIGVPMSSPIEESVRVALHMDLVPCPECGRSLQRHAPRCVYCGAKFPRGVADTASE